MRQAGALSSEAFARRFVDYLLTLGIEAKSEASGDAWNIWIFDENRLAESKAELAAFQADPSDEKYVKAAPQAAARRREIKAAQARASKNVVQMRDRWSRVGVRGRRPLTLALIGISCVIAILTKFGDDQRSIEPYLYMVGIHAAGLDAIDNPLSPQLPSHYRSYDPTLREIRSGEVWRLVTPIVVHQSFLHLLFNMFWLYALGGMIEDRYGTRWLAWLVLVSAVGSDLCQYFWAGPIFGGMSGVVYALFGYIWMKSKFDPSSGFRLDERTVFLMLVFFVVCFTGVIGSIANGAHAGGLVIGLILGYLPHLLKRRT